jgi:transposase
MVFISRPPTFIVLSESERKQLESLARAPRTERRYSDRARIILKASAGETTADIAMGMGIRSATVSKWRVRFESEGMEGLYDGYRPGRPPRAGSQDLRAKLLELLDEEPPDGYVRWNGRLLAERIGVKPDLVWKELRTLGISLRRGAATGRVSHATVP